MKLNRHLVLGALVAIPAVMHPNLRAEDTNTKTPIITLHTHKVQYNPNNFYRVESPVPTYETRQCQTSKYGQSCYNYSKPVEMHSYYQYGEVIKPKYTNVDQIIKVKKLTKNSGRVIKPIKIKEPNSSRVRDYYYNEDSNQYYTSNDDIRPNYTNVSQIQTKKK